MKRGVRWNVATSAPLDSTPSRRTREGVRNAQTRYAVEVVSCPENYFPPGSQFTSYDLNDGALVALGAPVDACWITGMVFRHLKTGERYEVVEEPTVLAHHRYPKQLAAVVTTTTTSPESTA